MPDQKISELAADASLTGTEQVPVNDGGTTKRTTLDAIRTLLGIPSQWSKGANGNVTATVDDASKTPLAVSGLVGQTGKIFRVIGAGARAVGVDGDDGLTFTALLAGVAGNDIDVVGSIDGPNTVLSYSEAGTTATIHLATDGSSVITSTAAQIAAIVNAQSTLVSAVAANGALVPLFDFGVSLAGGIEPNEMYVDRAGTFRFVGSVLNDEQFQIVGAPGSKENAAEIFAVYDDEGTSLWALDGIGGVRVFTQSSGPDEGKFEVLTEASNQPLVSVGDTEPASIRGLSVTKNGSAFVRRPSDDLEHPAFVIEAEGVFADANIGVAQVGFWYDHTNGAAYLMLKGKTADGTVVTGKVRLGHTVQTYTASNVSTDRSYNANATTIDELADVLGTLIADLRAQGIVA